MKKINIKYLLLSGIIITNYVLDGYAKTNKKNNNSYAASKNTTGGFNSMTQNAQGETIRSRTSSNSQESGHSATMIGQHGTVTSTNGQHTIENSADTKSKTITNKELFTKKMAERNSASQRNTGNVTPPTQQKSSPQQQSSSQGGSSNWGKLSVLAAAQSGASSNKSAMTSKVITEGAGLKAAQNAQQNSQSGSGSGSSGSSSPGASGIALMDAELVANGSAISSNSTPPKSGAPTAPAPAPAPAPASAPAPAPAAPATTPS